MMPIATTRVPGRTFAEPDPLRSLQSWRRYTCDDMPELSDADLELEARFLAARVWPLRDTAWQRQRLAALTREIHRRRGTDARQSRRPAEPKRLGGVQL